MNLSRLHARLLDHRRSYIFGRRAVLVGRYLLRQPHERDFEAFGLFPEREGLFLDVGANSGISAVSFRAFNRRSPIVSIEPNPLNEPDLRMVGRLLKDFRYVLRAAGERAGELVLYTPVYNGIPLTPEASLSPEQLAYRTPAFVEALGLEDPHRRQRLETIETRVPVVPLDELGLAPSFVKVDVQGWEVPVLRGLTKTLERYRPVVMVEAGPHTPDVDRLLAEYGYAPHVYDPRRRALAGRDTHASPVNVFYVVP